MKLPSRSMQVVIVAVVLSLASLAWKSTSPVSNLTAAEKDSSSMMLAHNVFFSLNDPTPANRQKLVDACKKYLSSHPGTVFFAAGVVGRLRPTGERSRFRRRPAPGFQGSAPRMTCIRPLHCTTSSSPRTRTLGRKCVSSTAT